MSLVLNSSGGGSVTLQEPVTAANVTQTLPSSDGTFALTSDVIGVGQTWQNLSPSRAYGTTYTNTTGKPIVVSIYGTTVSSVASTVSFNINGVTFAAFGMSQAGGITNGGSIIVPAGATYQVTSTNFSLGRWSELR